MAPKTSTKPASKAPVKEEVKAEPAAAAVTVVGAVGPNAGKTVQGMSFLSMLKKNPVAAEAPKEEEKPKPAPVAVDLPVAAAAPAKAKKGKKEAPAAAPVAAVEVPAAVVVEEPVAAAPVVAEPEPVVEPAVPEPEPVKAEEVVAAPQEVVAESTPAPAPFNWADAGSDFTQFSSRTEILAAQPEQVVEKLTPPGPLVTFRTPFVALSNLVFVAPSHTAMLLANRLTSIQQREEQLLLREKTLETQAAAEKARMAKNDKEIADLKQRLSAERDQLNRERTEFRAQQEKQQLQQQQQQQQQQQPHHHQPPHPHHPHTVFPSHSSHADVGRPSTSWADEDYGYDAQPVQYGQNRPAPQHYGRPNAAMPSHPRQMGTGYPSAYNQTRAPPMNRGAPPMGGSRPIYPPMHHHVHHHHQSHHQPQFGGHQYDQQQW